jgi:hypothetical protein
MLNVSPLVMDEITPHPIKVGKPTAPAKGSRRKPRGARRTRATPGHG